jgi:hypothetical protein
MRTAVTALAVGSVLVLAADPGRAATCVSDPASIAQADVAFVGRLTSLNPAGDQATLAVEEVWSTGDLAPVVVLNGSTGWASVEDSRYLVLATVVAGSLRIGEGECDVALPWDPSYANLRPATAHSPQTASRDGGLPMEILIPIGVAVLVVAVSAFAFRRTRGPGE